MEKKEYKVIATIAQLRSIGLDEDEFEQVGVFEKDYKDGWLCLVLQHKEPLLNKYPKYLDFPYNYVELITP